MVPTGIQIFSLDSAQERVEERAYQQRKNLFDYDE
jgi:preprotein translocase subunit SecA